MYDVIVVGAGCAGMTAAVYIRRAGKTVLVIDPEGVGGQIASSPNVENFPSVEKISGSEFSDRLFSQASALGAEFEFEKVNEIVDSGDVKTVVTDSSRLECRSVIIATGVKPRKLGIPREDELAGRGVSYCAVCDGAFFKGKAVAVAGGGNSALESALLLSDLCEKVYLIHRRDTFRGEQKLVDELKSRKNVELLMNCVISSLKGESLLEGLSVEQKDSGQRRELKVEGLFVAAGRIPFNAEFASLVELDADGYIKAGEDCRTTCSGIFAAGDCRTKAVRQLTTAAADGSVAALAAVR